MLRRVQRWKKKQRTVLKDRSDQGRGCCKVSAEFVSVVFDDLSRFLDVSIGHMGRRQIMC